jgi:hypothetical protein
MNPAELIEVRFRDLSRCISCRRIVTLRRIILEGRCKCSSNKVVSVTFLDDVDLRIIQEDYGDDCIITGGGKDNYADGLLPRGAGTEIGEAPEIVRVSEERLHSRRGDERLKESESSRRGLFERRWWLSLPGFLQRDPNAIRKARDENRKLTVPGISIPGRDR